MMSIMPYLTGELAQPTLIISMLYIALGSCLAYVLAQTMLTKRPGAQSFIYLIPLFSPIIALLLYPPSLMLPTTFFVQISAPANGGSGTQIITAATDQMVKAGPVPGGEIISIFGMLTLIGLASSIIYLTVMLAAGDRVVSYVCGVIPLTHDEKPELFTTVNRLCRLMQVPTPKVAIVEDLKPNAFTFGYGQNATIVCSIGLLNLLNKEEMKAVLAHEIAHVRNKDFNFKAVTSALKIMLFFNPLVHLFASAAYRQREILADKVSVSFNQDAYALGKALVKVSDAARRLPSNGFRWRVASSLFVISPTRKVSNAFSSHPPTVSRLSNLLKCEEGSRADAPRIVLLCIVGGLLGVLSAITYFTLAGPVFAWAANLSDGHVVLAIGLTPSLLQFGAPSPVWMTTSAHPYATTTLRSSGEALFIQRAIISKPSYYVPLIVANALGTVAILIGSLGSCKRGNVSGRWKNDHGKGLVD